MIPDFKSFQQQTKKKNEKQEAQGMFLLFLTIVYIHTHRGSNFLTQTVQNVNSADRHV